MNYKNSRVNAGKHERSQISSKHGVDNCILLTEKLGRARKKPGSTKSRHRGHPVEDKEDPDSAIL